MVVDIGAADMDAAFAGGVAAEDRPVMHEDDLGPVPGGRQGGAETGHASSHDADVRVMKFLRECLRFSSHGPPPSASKRQLFHLSLAIVKNGGGRICRDNPVSFGIVSRP